MTLPDLEPLRAALRRDMARFGTGHWRLVDDLVDAAFDPVIDSMMTRTSDNPPNRWHAYSLTIVRNLVRSGPHRLGLHRKRISGLADLGPAELVDAAPEQGESMHDRRDITAIMALLT